MEHTHERVQRVMVQLSLRIPTGCSQGALHESLKLKLLANFNNLPYFQVYLHGLGSQLWTLDARLDNGVPITSARLRNKIRETILPGQCRRSKIHFKQLILRLSVNGSKEEASPTENG